MQCLEQPSTASAITNADDNYVQMASNKHKKPGKQFFVTLLLQDGMFTSLWERFVECISFTCKVSIVSYVVAIERSVLSKRANYHLHSFLEFESPIYIGMLREITVSLWPGYK